EEGVEVEGVEHVHTVHSASAPVKLRNANCAFASRANAGASAVSEPDETQRSRLAHPAFHGSQPGLELLRAPWRTSQDQSPGGVYRRPGARRVRGSLGLPSLDDGSAAV